jgi:non-ribosomal peptide synthetase component F
MDSQLAYWQSQLSEPLLPLEFSTDAVRSDEASVFTARKEVSISSKIYLSVKSLAREEKTTPFIILLTALKILLSRYFDQDDIRVGTLVANRHRGDVENLIGQFANTVILRTKISENLSFKKLAQLVREITVTAHSKQDLPFEVLLQSLENDSSIRCEKLSPVLFIFQAEPQPAFWANLALSALDDFQNTSAPEVALIDFDVVLSVKERADGLIGFVVYKMFIFDATTISKLTRNFETLLERIVSDPDQPVFALRSSIEI